MTLTITPDQQRDIDRARAFLAAAAAEDRSGLAELVGWTGHPDDVYPMALGEARVRLAGLLAVVDALTGEA